MTTAAQRIAGGRVGVGRFDTVVLDYAGLLGQDIAADGDDSWQSLSGDGTGVSLAFQRADNYVPPRWPDGPPQQLHLDLTVDDFVTAHDQAVALGATPLLPTTAPDPDQTSGFRVYADPAGHPFCLCR